MKTNLNHIEAFCVLAETLSFSKTALQLNTSQSAISQKIKTMEHSLGTELFLRTQKSVSLTPQGILLRDGILPNYKEIIGCLKKDEAETQNLKIGSIIQAGERLVAPTIAEFIAKNKIKTFAINLMGTAELFTKLNLGQIDLALTYQQPSEKSLLSFEVFHDGSAFIGDSKVNLSDLERIPLITYREQDSYTQDFLKRNFTKSIQKKFHILGSVNSHRSMIEMTTKTKSFAVMPLLSVKGQKHLDLIKVNQTSHCLYLCTRRNFYENSQNKNLVDYFLKVIKSQRNIAVL